MIIDEEDYLAHYGTPRHSGRYPWGSGGDDVARSRSFLGYAKELADKGMSETEIAKAFDMTTTELRAQKSIAKNETRQADIIFAQRLKDAGYSNAAIGQRMGGLNESTVRLYLKPGEADKQDVLQTTAKMLKEQVDEKKFLDIGSGVENHVGVSRTKLDTAVAILKDQGYEVHSIKVDQLGTSHQTTVKVLATPGTTQKDIFLNRGNIRQITEKSSDGGRTFLGLHKPLSIDPRRVKVRYAEEGGTDADGVIYVRPGVPDLSLGKSSYAQVRIAVGDGHYLKGMAIYKNDLPAGTDLVFNTNKKDTGNKLDAMKPMKDDPDNPFGTVIKDQIRELDSKGNERVTSVMNIVNEEGDWDKWSRNLSSQMLSKQSPLLAKQQLDMAYEKARNDYELISNLTNPAVKRSLLATFSESADSSAEHMKAAAMPNQATRVILPVNSMRENEVYAPTFRNGEKVVLIRFPHGGKFEIPELTVNNREPGAVALLGRARDAIGINSKVAERLSGADFDGDSVLVIPNRQGRIQTRPPLEALKDFDTKHAYPGIEGVHFKTTIVDGVKTQESLFKGNTQMLMGDISNLITDMTIKGAPLDELARAVKHSMVVIDAEKHNLNYKQSAINNGIKALKIKYQKGATAGASTLISRKKSKLHIDERMPRRASNGGPIDRVTGERVFENTNRVIKRRTTDPVTGEVTVTESPRKMFVSKISETRDAATLSSGTPMEQVYVAHSNRMKTLANKARLAQLDVDPTPYSPQAKAQHSTEVASLNAKLNTALRNSPLERQAQIVANTIVSAKRQANPGIDAPTLKKIKGQAIVEARARVGAGKERIVITDAEWAAIQAGAISNHKLTQILANTDPDVVKKLATPKSALVMTPAKTARAKTMWALGYTQGEIAEALGVPVSTLQSNLERG